MIVRLTGTLIEVAEDSIVIERDGVAREVLIPPFAITELASCRGREVTLHTQEFLEGNQASGHLVPRILGFSYPQDRVFFRRFVGVKGIGPRKALKALSEPVRRIATWVESGDAKALTTLPGIGKRAAELLIATLRGKLEDFALEDAGSSATGTAQLSDSQRDALEVLIAWGDARHDAQRWIERAAQLHPELVDSGDWVRAALKVRSGAAG